MLMIVYVSCKRESSDFKPDPVLNITVVDDEDTIVSGARITVYDSDTAYEQAVLTRNFSAAIASTLTNTNGKGSLTLKAGKDLYVLITYFDVSRNTNLSNVFIGGFLSQLVEYQTLSLEITIEPEDGNIVFYTTNTNNPPIVISLENPKLQNYEVKTLSGVYTLNSPPTVKPDPKSSVFLRDPGNYKYFAKSQDGCIWTDTLSVNKGEIRLVNLSKCDNGYVYFYTTAVNDTLLPLSVKLNSTDSVGNITSSRAPLTCTDTKANTLTAIRNKGFYNYFVKSASGRCVWTGSFTLQTDDCIIVPIDICE